MLAYAARRLSIFFPTEYRYNIYKTPYFVGIFITDYKNFLKLMFYQQNN